MTHALAIETSHAVGSVLVRRADGTSAHAALTEKGGQARALAPAIADLLARLALAPKDLGVIVVGVGPGGYTGLRLGLATAKTLAVVLRIPIVGVTSTAALAAAAAVPAGAVLASVEATQGFVYGETFVKEADGTLLPRTPPFVEPAAQAAARAIAEGAVVVGSGARALAALGARTFAGAEELMPTAHDALNLGWPRFLRGGFDDERGLLPLYLRPSEAERLWALRERGAAQGGDGRVGKA